MMPISSFSNRIMEGLEQKRKRARERVEVLKGFYNHVKIFVLINGFLYLTKSGLFNRFMPEGFQMEPYYFGWLELNLIIWGGILVVHGIFVFHNRLPFFKKWEERQIRKFMEKDQDEVKKYR